MTARVTRDAPTPRALAPAISFADAAIGYGGVPVVSDAQLEVARGQLVGLVGPNGAGKSTLLRSLTGAAEVLSGAVRVAGEDVAALSARDRARIVGVLPQAPPGTFAFAAEEFVALGRHPHLGTLERLTAADEEIVERVMEQTDTKRLGGQRVDTLSGGDLQRLTLAQALAQEPEVLLLDEPTSHLDLNHRLQVLDLVRGLADEGLAVLAVFHDLDMACRYSDLLALVRDGHVEPPLAPELAITATSVRRVFGVRAVVAPDSVTGAISVTPVIRDEAIATASRGRVLVVGGSGVASPLMRRLVLDGWTVTAAALNAGDADRTLADALGVPYAPIPPFAPMDAAASAHVAELASEADAIIVCEVPFGHGNVGNLEAAVASGRPIVLVGRIAGRDFTGGEAEQLWSRALAAGAVQASGASGAVDALEQAVSRARGPHAHGSA